MSKLIFSNIVLVWSLLLCCNLAGAQTRPFAEPFNDTGYNNWLLLGRQDPDSTSFSVKAGKLKLENKSQKLAYVYRDITQASADILMNEMVDIQFSIRHTAGSRNLAYGISISGDTAKPGLFAMHIGLAANGYFLLYEPRPNGKMFYYNNWQKTNGVDTLENASNRFHIIKDKSSISFFVNDSLLQIVNGGFSKSSLAFFVTKNQSIEVENLSIKAFKGSFSKLEKDVQEDFKTICVASQDNFRNAFKRDANGAIKTWLPEVYIFFRDNRLVEKTDKEFFADKVKSPASRMVYSLSYPFNKKEERGAMAAKYTALVASVLKDFKTKTVSSKGVKTVFYSCKNAAFPKGLFVKLEEKEEVSIYNKNLQYHIKIEVTAAPGVKYF